MRNATLDKNSNFLHVGNLKDKARFSTHFAHLHKMLPYPLLVMYRKCEEMYVLENKTYKKSQFWPSASECHVTKSMKLYELRGLVYEMAVSQHGLW